MISHSSTARRILVPALLCAAFLSCGGSAFVLAAPSRFSPRQEFSSQGRQQQQPTRSLEVKGTLIYDGRARKLARRHPAASPHRRGKAIVALSGTATSGASGAATKSRRKARVTVRRAKEADYAGVAGIRSVIIPVGMSGATGFLGGKVVIDDPAEAERRLLLSKVADLVSGKAVALIALEGGRIVGTIDCSLQQPAEAPGAAVNRKRRRLNPEGPADASISPAARKSQREEERPQPRLFLANLFVLPAQRRRGIARELVKAAEAFARKERADTVCLQVTRNNESARKLYFSCGFEEAEQPGPVEGGMGGVLLKSLGMGKRYMVKSV